MHDLIQQGKVLYWGTSEWSAVEIMEAYSVARQYHLTPPTMEQPQYNMLHRGKVEADYYKLYNEIGLGTTIWSPLASGILTGKYNKGIPKDSRANKNKDLEWLTARFKGKEGQHLVKKIEQIQTIANSIETTPASLAIAWCLKNPNVSTVITGASKVSQVKENMKAGEIVKKLSPTIMTKLEKILDNQPKFRTF